MRRTPALTKTCRDIFEEALDAEGWVPGSTFQDIAYETGLTTAQVRDAIWGPSADVWRRSMLTKRRKVQ